jgi:hypothetical protein
LAQEHSQRKAHQFFGISLITVSKWHKIYQSTENLKDKPTLRKFRKLAPERLKSYIKEHPSTYLKKISEVFGCLDAAVWFKLCFLPILLLYEVIIMGKVLFHSKDQLFSLAEEIERRLTLLSVYSPEINPLETFGS